MYICKFINSVLLNIPTKNSFFYVATLFWFVVCFARVWILNSRHDSSSEVLISVFDFFFVGNFSMDKFSCEDSSGHLL